MRKDRRQDADSRDVLWERPAGDIVDPDIQFALRARRLLGMNLARWQRWLTIGLIMIVIYFQMNPVASTVRTPGTDLDPDGKTQAWAYTEAWLKDKPLGADPRIISWDGMSVISMRDGSDTVKAGVHTLTVDTDEGWWKVQVTIRADGTMGGWPSATRVGRIGGPQPNPNDDWPGTLGSLTPPEALQTSVTQWAAAFMGDDSNRLTTLLHDPDPAAAYQAQRLGEVASASIEKAAYLDQGNVDRNEGKSDRAVLRVTVTLAAKGVDGKQTQFTYDLLAANPDGTPTILAWGAPGTGPRLKEHGNRLPQGVKPDDPDGTDTDTDTGADTGAKTDAKTTGDDS